MLELFVWEQEVRLIIITDLRHPIRLVDEVVHAELVRKDSVLDIDIFLCRCLDHTLYLVLNRDKFSD